MDLESTAKSRFRRHQGAIGLAETVMLALIPITGIVGILDIFLSFGVSPDASSCPCVKKYPEQGIALV